MNENRAQMSVAVTSYNCPLATPTGIHNAVTIPVEYASGSGDATVAIIARQHRRRNTLYPRADLHRLDKQSNRLALLCLEHLGQVKNITITFSGGTPSFVKAATHEYYNVATSSALDGSGSCTATGSNISCWICNLGRGLGDRDEQ